MNKLIIALLVLLTACGDGRLSPQGGTITGATPNGGLVVTTGKLGLLTTCADTEVLVWNDGTSTWACGEGGATYTAGDGLLLTDTDFDVVTGTGITITADAVTLNMDGASCGAGEFVSAITATGGTTCTASSYSTLSGAFSDANVIPKGDGTGLTASSWTDDGTVTASSATAARVTTAAGAGTSGYFEVGQEVTSTTANHVSHRISPWGDGNAYFETKVGNAGSLIFTTGHNTEPGSTRGWLTVIGSTGAATFPQILTATAGVTTPANLTTTGTGALVVAGTGTIGDTLDVNGDLSKFGSADGAVYLYLNTINGQYSVDAEEALAFNYRGYQNGTTQFRNTYFYDGKEGLACSLTGSTKSLNCVGGLQENGTAVLSGAITANVVPKGSGGNLVDSAITDDGTNVTVTGRNIVVTGDLALFGTSTVDGVYINNNQLNWGYNENSDAIGYINYSGYQSGTTRFRDLVIADGKNTTVCTFDGSDKSLNCVGGLQENGAAVLSGAITDNTIPKGSSGNLVDSTITDNGTTLNTSNNLVTFGTSDQILFRFDTINFGNDANSEYTGIINHTGYSVGTTQFRNLKIRDGKNADIATFTGSDKSLAVVGDLSTSAAFTAGDAGSDGPHGFNGSVRVGDTASTSIDSNLDVLTIGNTGTGQTSDSKAVIRVTNSGTYNAGSDGSNLNEYGVVSTMTATRSAGTDVVTSWSILGQASGAQQNVGVGATATGAATVNYAIYSQASGGTTNYSFHGASGNFYNANDGQFGAALTVNGNATIGDSNADSHTFNGDVVITEGTPTAAAAAAGTMLRLDQENGQANILTMRGNTTKQVAFANSSGAADGAITYDGSQSRAMRFATSGIVRQMINSAGTTMFGDVTTAINDNVDVIQIGNTGTGQTTSGLALIDATHTGSFNTTAGAISTAGFNVSITSTRSSGANPLTNAAIVASASGGQSNFAILTTAGEVFHSDALTASRITPDTQLFDHTRGFEVFEEFMSTPASVGETGMNACGAVSDVYIGTDTNRPGIIGLQVSQDTVTVNGIEGAVFARLVQGQAGSACYGSTWYAGGGQAKVAWGFRINPLSDPIDGSDSFVISAGLIDYAPIDDLGPHPDNGIYCRADGTSANWKACTAEGTTSTCVLFSPAVPIVEDAWMRCEFTVNAAGTQVDFTLTNVTAGTSGTASRTVNIPNDVSHPVALGITIDRNGSNGDGWIEVDYGWMDQTFTVSR